MARAQATFSPQPQSSVPHFARDAHELSSVVEAQKSESLLLKTRLGKQHREITRLQQRLRDAEGELVVAADATTSATERLGSHAERHGLVLASAVERSGAERSNVEMELQRVEATLHDRDVEIRKLRRQAHQLEADMHQHDMSIKGLQHLHENSRSMARTAGREAERAKEQFQGQQRQQQEDPRSPSQHQARRLEEAESQLSVKRHQLATLKQQAEAAAQEAKKAEGEHESLGERLRSFQAELHSKKEGMKSHDDRFKSEVTLLRDHCEQLRRILHQEQRDAVAVDQRAVLQPQCTKEAETVQREQLALLEKMPRLASTLQQQGQRVRSPLVAEEPIDGRVHSRLEQLDRAGQPTPSVVWRLSAGEYLLGDQHVVMQPRGEQLEVGYLGGGMKSLDDALVTAG